VVYTGPRTEIRLSLTNSKSLAHTL